MKAERYFTVDKDGFYGAYFPIDKADHAFIAMLGDDIDDLLAKTGVKWLQKRGYNCLTMSPAKADYGHHNYPLERFDKAIAFLKEQGNRKIGIIGASTTGMLALITASYYPDITMTLAFSPSDFVMEGFYRDGKDGATERPGDGESTVSLDGKPLPYLPFAYRHPEYWQKIQEESKGSGNFISSVHLFDESEKRHPLQEAEKIRVEKIQGHIVFIGAEDDVLWDTCRYIRRMEERLSEKKHACTYDSLCYRYGTHFIFPESMLKMMLPIGSKLILGLMFRSTKEHPSECKETRIDIEKKLQSILQNW
ncbi:MAG: acyl-CoA thioester hydrolase [Erysipelotrichaceae bacterium]|nr:acyl-CoA thioester hydrolase [Erysipelotrichaceae bacterium]